MKASPGIVQLAGRIEGDIRERALSPGHPYETTAETARRFGVSTGRANKALQLLSNRGVIVRRQRAGAVVGDVSAPGHSHGLTRMHVIVSEVPVRTEGLLDDGVLLGLQAAVPGVMMQQHFLPGEGNGNFIAEIVSTALKAKGKDGFVLFRAPAVIQRTLAMAGLPTVVSGSVDLSVEGVAALDRDQYQIGVELAAYALRKRCSRFVVILRDRLGPGDRSFAQGVTRTLADAGVALDCLSWEWAEADDASIRAIAKEYRSSRGKVAYLCRNEYLAEQTERSLLPASSRKPLAPLIVMADCYRSNPEEARFPFPRPAWSPEEVGAKLGQLLIEQVLKTRHESGVSEIRIPVSAID